MSELSFPEHLQYSPDHEWLDQEGLDATIGITAFAARELGDIVYVDILEPGRSLRKGEVFGTIEAVKTVSDLIMPVSGTILEINPKVIHGPHLINEDPYDEAWLVRISISKPEETKQLLSQTQYLEII